MNQVLRLGANLVLTRLLVPEEFGLMVLVLVTILGLEMLSDLGIAPAIVQNHRGDDRAFLNTAWTVQVIRGFILWAFAFPVAYLVAALFAQPMLIKLVPVAAAAAAINGFNSTKLATCQRHLRLGLFTSIDLASYAIGMTVMIAWAYIHRNVWALVVGTLVTATAKMVLSHVALPGHPNRLEWDRSAVGPLIRFGRWIFVSTLATYLALQADKLLLGTLLTPDLLGIYGIGFMLATLPINVIRKIGAFALYPALSRKAREDPAQLRAKLIEARGMLLPAGMLTVLASVLWAPAFFGYLYEGPYKQAAWMCQMLAVPIWFQILQASVDRAPLALGHSHLLALSNLCNVVATVLLCLLGHAYWKLPGFIIGLGGGSLVGHAVIQVALLRRGINVLKQDVQYTVALAVLVAIAIVAARVLTGAPLTVDRPLTSVLIGTPLVLLALGFVLHRLKFIPMPARVATPA